MVLGHSAATAAAQAIDAKVAVQDVEYAELRDRLKADVPPHGVWVSKCKIFASVERIQSECGMSRVHRRLFLVNKFAIFQSSRPCLPPGFIMQLPDHPSGVTGHELELGWTPWPCPGC